jgi:chromosome segregation ATPase
LLSTLECFNFISFHRTHADYVSQYYKAQRLDREKTILSNEKRELEKQLAEKTRASQVSASQVFTLGLKVRELERRNAELSGDLAKRREDTRNAGLLFMEAADRYQQVAEKQIRAKDAELEDARKASAVIMDAADAYQNAAREEAKAKVEELEDMKAAVLVLMSAADTYQQEAKRLIREKVEELKILGVQKEEMDARAASLESELDAALSKNRELEAGYDSVKGENCELRSEVERLMMELGVLAEAGEVATTTKVFDGEKTEIIKEFQDLRRMMKVGEIQTAGKDFMKGENDKLWSEVPKAE